MSVALTPEAAYLKACERYAGADPAGARDLCRRVLAADPGHMHAAYLLAVIEQRLGDAVAGDRSLAQALAQRAWSARLSYLPPAAPRHATSPHPALAALLEAQLGHALSRLQELAAAAPGLARIPAAADDARAPYWNNAWIPPLDGIALYALVATRRPRLYVEIGSGNSTRFVRRAIDDHGLSTRIVSIDPQPRADVDALCDEVLRAPLETVDLAVFARLGAGDMVFADNSHQCLAGSDVTVFFTEVLPSLAPGVLAGIHDIFLPYDYPAEWSDKRYSEQYLLACYLLAQTRLFGVELPLHFLSRHAGAAAALGALCAAAGGVSATGSSFWLTKN